MTGSLRVDTAALEALARELAAAGDQMLSDGTTHEWQPPVDQPSGRAAVAVTAAANHVVSESSANLLLFADNIAQAAKFYAHVDSAEARKISTIEPPR